MVNLINSIRFGSLIASTAVSFLISAIWYGPLFGGYWLEYSHLNKKKIEDYRQENKYEKIFIAILCSFLVGLVYSNLMEYLLVEDCSDALYLSFMIWLGFVFTSYLNNFLWEPTKKQVFLINITHQLVNFLAQGLTIYYVERKLFAL